MKNVIKLNETELKKIVSESVKRVLKETELDYDMDNFSGRWNRGTRYDILVNDYPEYSDIPEEAVDNCYNQLLRRGYSDEEIEVKEK